MQIDYLVHSAGPPQRQQYNQQMEPEKAGLTGATFFTETRPRPQTSHIARNKSLLRQQFCLDPQIDPSHRLKALKQELRELQQAHLSMVVRVNDSKKAIDKRYRHSQQTKVQFLNLYEQRKVRLQEKKLLEEKEQKEGEHRQVLRERTKSMKLNGQVRALLLRNELQDNNSQLCSRNRRAKQRQRQELQRRRQTDLSMARSSYARIKAGEGDLHLKMQKIGEMQAAMGRSNYARKLGEEIEIVQYLDKQLGQMCREEFCDKCTGEEPLFLTQKGQ